MGQKKPYKKNKANKYTDLERANFILQANRSSATEWIDSSMENERYVVQILSAKKHLQRGKEKNA